MISFLFSRMDLLRKGDLEILKIEGWKFEIFGSGLAAAIKENTHEIEKGRAVEFDFAEANNVQVQKKKADFEEHMMAAMIMSG